MSLKVGGTLGHVEECQANFSCSFDDRSRICILSEAREASSLADMHNPWVWMRTAQARWYIGRESSKHYSVRNRRSTPRKTQNMSQLDETLSKRMWMLEFSELCTVSPRVGLRYPYCASSRSHVRKPSLGLGILTIDLWFSDLETLAPQEGVLNIIHNGETRSLRMCSSNFSRICYSRIHAQLISSPIVVNNALN